MPLAQAITPQLRFDARAREAAGFYCSVFPDSGVESVVRLRDTPSGDCDVVTFALHGQPFLAIGAESLPGFNPSMSFFVNFDPSREADAAGRLDRTWKALAEGGQVLMPLQAYPFSPRYGWVQDRFGLSWQLILSDPSAAPRPAIVPALLFTGQACGRAEEAGAFYRSVFDGSQAGELVRYPEGMPPDRAGTVMYSDFRLGDTWFAAMDSAHAHGFGFNEAISFVVACRDQADIDRHWAQLSGVPEAERCGRCRDRHGLSWQVVPTVLHALMASGDEEAVARVSRAVLGMGKPDVAAIEAAARGDR